MAETETQKSENEKTTKSSGEKKGGARKRTSRSSNKSPQERARADAKKRLQDRKKRDGGEIKGLDANDPLLGWTAQQGPAKSPLD